MDMLNCWIRGRPSKVVIQVKISSTETVATLKEAVKNKKPTVFHVDADTISLYKPTDFVPRPYEENLGNIILSEQEKLGMGDEVLSTVFSHLPPAHIHTIAAYPSSSQLILFLLQTRPMMIVCWLRDSTLSAGSQISIPSADVTIGQLKSKLSQEQSSLRNVEHDRISLYRISGDEDELKRSPTKSGAGEPLQGPTLLPDFLGVPVLDPLYVVVEVTPKAEKNAREEAYDSIMEAPKRAKIATNAPSNTASSERGIMRNGCSTTAVMVTTRFGQFLYIFYDLRRVPDVDKVSSRGIRMAVDIFAEKMSRVHADEDKRKTAGLSALNDVLSERSDGLSFQLAPAWVSRNTCSDSHIIGPHTAIYCVAEFKNEGGDVTILYVEMLGYFANSIRTVAANPDHAPLLCAWNFPCLRVTIVGHYVMFYAMIYFGVWRVVSLMHPLSCIQRVGDGNERNPLYKAFTVASVLLARIKQDAQRLITTPSLRLAKSNLHLPYISSLLGPNSQSRITFKILQSFDLHAFCARKGFAPKVLGFERLPGGFFGIAMELFDRAYPFSEVSGSKIEEWKKELEELVQPFHDSGYVHEDLRSPNIFCDGEKVKLLHFDWGGKQWDVYYPEGPLNPDLERGRDISNLEITKDDDIRVLRQTLDSVV
ncbi:hypothetical protein OG21DRAFT_1490380 [Imleria badia]|nr:hypothetical protein OG21DRAFT_1490380 [Imleria badia]